MFNQLNLLWFTAGNLFSDPDSQTHVDEDELPDHMSDDDDDARLTHNTREAMNMGTPTKLKKPDQNAVLVQKAQ